MLDVNVHVGVTGPVRGGGGGWLNDGSSFCPESFSVLFR